MTVSHGAREDARALDWWYSGNVEEEGSITSRTIAYLRTYLDVAGQPKLYAAGIPLDRGRLWMDKYVIRRLHRDGYLEFHDGKDPFFAPTEQATRLTNPAAPG
jgi:hypothetical protein